MMMPMGLFWLGLMIVGTVLLVKVVLEHRSENKPAPTTPENVQPVQSTDSPKDILLKEFARGAITEEEFLAKKKYFEE